MNPLVQWIMAVVSVSLSAVLFALGHQHQLNRRTATARKLRRFGFLMLVPLIMALAWVSPRRIEDMPLWYLFQVVGLVVMIPAGIAGFIKGRNDAYPSYRQSAWFELFLLTGGGLILVFLSEPVFRLAAL